MKNAIFLFAFFALIYSFGMFTRIPFGDCVNFVLTVEKGRFEHSITPTSHILYCNTAILIKNILGIDGILASRIIVIGSGAFTVAIVYFTTRLFTTAAGASVIAAIVFGLSFSFWRNAEIVEVYTFTTAIVVLYFYFASKYLAKKSSTDKIFAALFLGLSLWAHIQNILLIPSFIFLLFGTREKAKSAIALYIFLLIFGGLFALNYLHGLPPSKVFQSEQNNWVEQSFQKSATTYAKDLLKSVLYLIYNFNIFTLFGFIGIRALFRKDKTMFWFFFIAAFFVYGFATFYAVSDNYVFFLPFNLIFAVGIGYGISHIDFRYKMQSLSLAAALIPIFYLVCYFLALKIPAAKEFDNAKAYKGGLKYYLLPWMKDNKGIVKFTIDKETPPEPMGWMTVSAEEFIQFKLSQGFTIEEIKEL